MLTKTKIKRNIYHADIDDIMYAALWTASGDLDFKELSLLVLTLDGLMKKAHAHSVGPVRLRAEKDTRGCGGWLHTLRQDVTYKEDFNI